MKYEMTENKKFVRGIELTQIRYENGSVGGWIKDQSVLRQDSDAKIYPNACILGGDVYGGRIRGGVIHGGAIFGGEIYGGEIWGGRIWGGEIRGGEICGGEIHGGVIYGGRIRGGVIRGGEIRGGVIRGGVIHGGAIFGGEIYGGMVVTRSPIYMILPRHKVTISDNMVAVGCQVHPFDFWKDKQQVSLLGVYHNYTPEEIDMYYSMINNGIAFMEAK